MSLFVYLAKPRASLMSIVLGIVMALFGLSTSAQAMQFSSPSEFAVSAGKSSKSVKKNKSAKSKKSGKSTVTFHNGSAESVTERERRLKRECKGRSNSGLCEGFTR